MRFLLSTVADTAWDESDGSTGFHYIDCTAPLAAQYGMGLELAEFCIAENLDVHLSETDRKIQRNRLTAPAEVLHAPYNELFPCAIDPRAAALASFRYGQALELAQSYGIRKIVVHSGYVPNVYFEEWFVERSAAFWRKFLQMHDGEYEICLENVMDENPRPLCALAEQVGDPRFGLCLDVGHAAVVSQQEPLAWLEQCAPHLSHLHLHNNDGKWDTHNAVDDGILDNYALLMRCRELCPDVTCTVESTEAERSVRWLLKNGFLGKEHKLP